MNSRSVLVVTGSGISADSGIPTFRGKDGYWRNHNPRDLATEEGFNRDPVLVWQWYRERRALIRQAKPNAGHEAIVQLSRSIPRFLLLTQNVDDLHQRARWNGAALASESIVQIHGDIFATRCTRCDFRRPANSEDESGVPGCPRCGSALRPAVIWFDEELDAAEQDRVRNFLAAGACDLVLVVGTTAQFDYIVEWALQGKGDDGRLIEVNPDVTPLSGHANETVRSTAATALPGIVGRLVDAPR